MSQVKIRFNIDNFLKVLPIIVLTSIVPLIMIVKLYLIPEDIKHVMMKGDYVIDIYSYYKMILIGLMGLYMTIIVIKDIIVKKKNIKYLFRENKIFIIPLLLITLLILTTVFSSYKSVAINGLPERFEGFYAFYTYILLIFYIPYVFENTTNKLYIVYKCTLISALIVSAIGLLEYYGYYIIETEWFKSIAVFGKLKGVGINVKYSLPPKTLASSLYNPNYMGSYLVMLLFLAIALMVNKKINIIKNTLSLASIGIFILTLVYSNSATGYIAISFTAVLFIILITLRIRSSKVFVISSLVLVLSLGCIYYEEFMLEKPGIIRTEYTNFKTLIEQPNPYAHVESIAVKSNVLSLGYRGEILTIILDSNKGEVFFFDTDNKPLKYILSPESKLLTTTIEPFNEIQLALNPDNTYTLKTTRWPMLNLVLQLSKEGISYIDYYGNPVKDTNDNIYPRWGFEGYEKIASGRGYIWSLSIPLIKDSLLLGHGSDTFAIVFPQDDFIGKLAYFGNQNAFIDKPHNLYLQLGITQGVLFTLIFVGLVLYLIIKLIRDLFKYRKMVSIERISIMCGVIAYMIAGIANDSTVGTGPVFWSLLGISILHYIDDKEVLRNS